MDGGIWVDSTRSWFSNNATCLSVFEEVSDHMSASPLKQELDRCIDADLAYIDLREFTLEDMDIFVRALRHVIADEKVKANRPMYLAKIDELEKCFKSSDP